MDKPFTAFSVQFGSELRDKLKAMKEKTGGKIQAKLKQIVFALSHEHEAFSRIFRRQNLSAVPFASRPTSTQLGVRL